MKIPQLRKKLEVKSCHNTSWEDVQKSYKKIMKKIHPDISPELNRLASIVNEAKDTVLKNLS